MAEDMSVLYATVSSVAFKVPHMDTHTQIKYLT